MGAKQQRGGTIFLEVDPSRHRVKILIWRLSDKMIKKWDREIFIFHAIIPALYPSWRKFSLLS